MNLPEKLKDIEGELRTVRNTIQASQTPEQFNSERVDKAMDRILELLVKIRRHADDAGVEEL